MDKHNFELSDIFELEEWQKVQDYIAMVTKLSIVTSDYRGVPFTRGSNCTDFCVKARSDPHISKYCHRCDSIGGLEAAKIDAPYIYTCHMGRVDLAVPIIAGGKYIGAIVAGQIHISDMDIDNMPEQIVSSNSTERAREFLAENMADYNDMPVLTMEELYYASKLLYHICGYITRQATKQYATSCNDPAGISLPAAVISDPRPTFGNPPPVSPGSKTDYLTGKDEVLRPAFEYIYSNRDIFPAQPDMARLCHLSPSYFSRLFRRETGVAFSQYIAGLKIEWAKELLLDSSLSVTNISDSLGYSSPSYFIKSFKEREHLTPHAYRDLVRMNNASLRQDEGKADT